MLIVNCSEFDTEEKYDRDRRNFCKISDCTILTPDSKECNNKHCNYRREEKYKGLKGYELAVDCLKGDKEQKEVFSIWVKSASAINLLNGIEYCVQEGILKRHEIINLMILILKETEEDKKFFEDGLFL